MEETLIKRFDEQDDRLKAFESRMEANTQAVRENREEISKVKEEMLLLKKENASLKQICLEQARYKRRWDLRLMGLPEKDKEDTRETVIGILTRVIPVSVEKLRESVDTVHRLGKKNDAATNKMPRPVIIQFALRTVRDEVWRRSREARVCREMNIQFNTSLSKWEWFKFKIRQIAVDTGKKLSCIRKWKQKDLIDKINQLTSNVQLSLDNITELKLLQSQLDDMYTTKANGAYVRSRARWIEKGEKSSTYFFGLEKQRQSKKKINL
ncbi:hypothetical protein PO909_012977 [Leuciscus waleckii]